MLPSQYQKRSFLKFSPTFDVEKLRQEYAHMEQADWANSYWGKVHCSVGMLLLRGGNTGTEKDFYCDHVEDSPLLTETTYLQQIIGADGPFGLAKYAFIFKMKANGVTLKHQDLIPRWKNMFRIHVPIYTNSDAYLISNDHSVHFAQGHAWSFDNQSDHGVVNGNEERVHLIFDVDLNPKLKQQIDQAAFIPGEIIQRHLDLINATDAYTKSYPGDELVIEAFHTMVNHGLNATQIATILNQQNIPTKYQAHSEWTVDALAEIVKKQG